MERTVTLIRRQFWGALEWKYLIKRLGEIEKSIGYLEWTVVMVGFYVCYCEDEGRGLGF